MCADHLHYKFLAKRRRRGAGPCFVTNAPGNQVRPDLCRHPTHLMFVPVRSVRGMVRRFAQEKRAHRDENFRGRPALFGASVVLV